MGFPNLAMYAEFEKAIKAVGENRLREFVLSRGHKIDKFDRDMEIIRYTLQHGTYAASKIFHLSESYPSGITYRYGRLALELAELLEKEKK